MAIDVVVAGATGKSGSVIARGIVETSDMRLVGAVAPHHAGRSLSSVIAISDCDLEIAGSLDALLESTSADVVIDFTTPTSGRPNAIAALKHGVRPVIGTTGFTKADLDDIDRLAKDHDVAALIAPNFSIGGLLLERLARQAAALLPMVEVIELHHIQKKDAPSGTAARLADRLSEAGARSPVPVHSVRLPGLVAHHEALFGGTGEILTIRHDTISREAFVPGVLIATRAIVRAKPGLITDLWPLVQAAASSAD